MTSAILQGSWASWLIAAGMVMAAGTAEAQECAADADCGAGFSCRVSRQLQCSGGGCTGEGGSSGMAGTGGATGAIDGGVAVGGMSGGCETEPVVCQAVNLGFCEQDACGGDDECQALMVCAPQTEVRCAITDPCPQQESCVVDPADVETICENVTTSTCVARSALTCEEDADCGAGFSCVPGGEVCTCDGGSAGGTGGGSGMGECTCTQVNVCELQVLPCEADGDCPSEFSCEPNPCIGCGGSTGGAGGGPAEQDGGMAMPPDEMDPNAAGSGCEPDPAQPTTVCRPPAYLGDFGCPGGGGPMGGTGGGGGNQGEAGQGTGGGGAGQSGGDAGVPTGEGGMGGSGGSAGSAGDSGGHHPWPHFPHLGCAATGSAASDALSSLGLMALSLLMMRRRRSQDGTGPR